MDAIYDCLKNCAVLAANAGGCGISIQNIRVQGSFIQGSNGTSSGIVPLLQVYNNTTRYVDQGGKVWIVIWKRWECFFWEPSISALSVKLCSMFSESLSKSLIPILAHENEALSTSHPIFSVYWVILSRFTFISVVSYWPWQTTVSTVSTTH